MFLIKLFFTLERLLQRLEEFLLGLSLVIMILMTTLQVVLRNVFDSGIEWGDLLTRHMVLFVLFFGASLATRDKRHISVDVFGKMLPAKVKPFLDLFISLFAIIVSLFLFAAAYQFMQDERTMGEILFAGIPTWNFVAIMPLGFLLLSFRFFVELVEIILNLSGIKRADWDAHCTEIEVSVKIKL